MRNMVFGIAMMLAGPLSAEDYRIKITEIAKGSSVTYLTTNHGHRTHHFEGPVEGGYEVSYWKGRGKGQGAGIAGIGLFDSDGRMLRYTQAGGKPESYTPHNCFRVVGTCSYTVTRSDGSTSKIRRRLEPTENGFEFEVFRETENGEEMMDRGHVTLDEMGMMKSLTVEASSTPNRSSLEQESADYR